MKSLSIGKRLTVAAVAAVALAGPVTAAHALQFGAGDAILAVYGNGTEYVADIGTISNVINNGADVDLNPFLASIGPIGSLKYTLIGFNGTMGLFGDASPLSSFTATNKNQTVTNVLVSGLATWSGQLGTAADARTLFPTADPLSFSSNMDIGGSGTLSGTLPSARPGFASIDSILNLIEKTGTSSPSMVQVNTALFSSSTGHFVVGPVSPVPVPAAVVLFATGVIGLIGVARRRGLGIK